MHARFWPENLKGRDHLGDLGMDGRLLEWTLGKMVGSCGLDSCGSGYGLVVSSCERSK